MGSTRDCAQDDRADEAYATALTCELPWPQKQPTFAARPEARIVDYYATLRLLEPRWGLDVKPAAFTVPRLVLVTIDSAALPDFVALRVALAADGHGEVLSDDRAGVDCLVAIARSTMLARLSVLAVMLAIRARFASSWPCVGLWPERAMLDFVGAEARLITG